MVKDEKFKEYYDALDKMKKENKEQLGDAKRAVTEAEKNVKAAEKNLDKAKDILPELLSSFERCKGFIDEIYHVGLYQNLFEYYSYVGDKESAEKYYKMALESAKKNYWKGKEKKLTNLKIVYE